jgi:hypothetical protein
MPNQDPVVSELQSDTQGMEPKEIDAQRKGHRPQFKSRLWFTSGGAPILLNAEKGRGAAICITLTVLQAATFLY